MRGGLRREVRRTPSRASRVAYAAAGLPLAPGAGTRALRPTGFGCALPPAHPAPPAAASRLPVPVLRCPSFGASRLRPAPRFPVGALLPGFSVSPIGRVAAAAAPMLLRGV